MADLKSTESGYIRSDGELVAIAALFRLSWDCSAMMLAQVELCFAAAKKGEGAEIFNQAINQSINRFIPRLSSNQGRGPIFGEGKSKTVLYYKFVASTLL